MTGKDVEHKCSTKFINASAEDNQNRHAILYHYTTGTIFGTKIMPIPLKSVSDHASLPCKLSPSLLI
jgi:hypothetical protein